MNLSTETVNEGVVAVLIDGTLPGGHFKRIAGEWKFKAMGYEGEELIPGGGPLTSLHNLRFASPDVAALLAALKA